MTLTNHNLLKIKFLKIRSAKGLFAQAISQAPKQKQSGLISLLITTNSFKNDIQKTTSN